MKPESDPAELAGAAAEGRLTEVMSRPAVTADPSMTLAEAARTMREHQIGFLPVVDGSGPIGALTDRDVTVRGLGRDLDPTSSTVTEVMTPNVASAFADQSIDQAVDVMRDRRVRRLLVVDDAHKLLGVLSVRDLVKHSVAPASLAELLARIHD